MKRYLLSAAAVLLSINLFSQGGLKGLVTDQTGAALAGATVTITDINRGVFSSDSGNYSINDLPAGKFRVQFSYIGYSTLVETVVISDSIIKLNARLHEAPVESEEVVITGGYTSSQHENAVKIDNLKMNEPNLPPFQSLSEFLKKVPGVDMISKGPGVSKPVIRGLAMNDILVLNNGFRFENYQYSDHHPLGLDEFGVEKVEIIKGPASLLYGSDAIGGVINFIKERPAAENTVAGDYNLQMFSNSLGMLNNFGIRATKNGFSAGIRAGQKSSADYLMGGGDFVPNSRFSEYSVRSNAGYSGKSGTFRLFYDHIDEKPGLVEEEPVQIITSRGRKPEIFYQRLNTDMISSRNKVYLGKFKADINASLQNTELVHFAAKDVYEIQMKLSTLSYETKLYLPSGKNSEYILGFQGLNQFNSNLNNRPTVLLPDATVNSLSGFFLLQKTLFEKLKVQGGGRFDHRGISTSPVGELSDTIVYRPSISRSYNSSSGSVGASWTFSDRFLIRLNSATAFRTPNLAELTSKGPHETRFELGDAGLNPEKSLETDLSLHYHTDHISFDAAGFYNGISNFIFISPTGTAAASGLPVYRYIQKNSLLYGGEAGIHLHPSFIEWMHLETDFSGVRGKRDDGKYLPFIPADRMNIEMRAEKEGLRFAEDAFISAGSSLVFKQFRAAPDESPTDAYTLLNASLGATFRMHSGKLILIIGANNLLDKKYVDHLSTLKEVNLYNPGRNFSLSLRIPFSMGLASNTSEK
jgi:iron complex outermembrane recepter protein